MNSTVEKTGNNLVKLTITVSHEEFEEGKKRAYAKKKGTFAAVPGFRKGKAPLKVFEAHYGEHVLFEDAFEEVFPETYQKAVMENDIKVVDRPSVDIDNVEQDGTLIYTAEVYVMPEVKLGEYKGIEIEEIVYNVSEDEVNNAVEKELEKAARWVEADREVQNGDNIILDFKGMVDGEAFEGGTAEDYMLEDVGSGKFIPGFEEQLVGMKKDETKDVKVTFPEEYGAKELAGKEAVFVCTIKDVKEKELPELDDEFAKDVSEFDTLEEYKEDVKKNLQEDADKKAFNQMLDEVVKKATDNAEIDIPDCMIQRQIDYIVEDMNYRLSMQGLNVETYLQYTGSTMEAFRDECKTSAYDKVKTQLVLDAIIEEEKIQASEELMNKELEAMANMYAKDVESFKEQMSEDDKGYLESSVLYKTATQFLLDNAKKGKAKKVKKAKKVEEPEK